MQRTMMWWRAAPQGARYVHLLHRILERVCTSCADVTNEYNIQPAYQLRALCAVPTSHF